MADDSSLLSSFDISSGYGFTTDHRGHESNGRDVKFWNERKKRYTRRSVEYYYDEVIELERRINFYDRFPNSPFDRPWYFSNSFDSSDSSDSSDDGSEQERSTKKDRVIRHVLEAIAEAGSESYRDDSSKFSREVSTSDESLDAFQEKVKLLKFLRGRIDWNVKKSRSEIYRLLDHSVTDWQGRLPSLRDIFQDEEIERLMFDQGDESGDQVPARKFIEFAISTGYKDEPKLDEDGRPILRRTTPIHLAARLGDNRAVVELFKIYDRYDANYCDEDGLTHFYLACRAGCRDVVEKFLRLGQVDPNEAPKKGPSPLLLALAGRRDEVARLLLRHGADPNATNEADGSTPLHEICRRYLDDDFVELFFRINDERRQLVTIDARDKRGRTPLQLAVANFQPKSVNLLLDRGADLSSFVFPSEDYFAEGFQTDDFPLKSVSRVLSIVASLEKRGYELDRSEALTIIKFFHMHGLFRADFELEAYLCHHKRFAKKAKRTTFGLLMSLHDLLRLPLDEAEQVLLEAADCSRFDDSTEDWHKLLSDHEPCALYLCEIMTSGFVQRWPREFYRYIFLNK